MKKLLSILAIAVVAMTSFTSCDTDEPTPDVTKAKVSVTAPAVMVGADGEFTVTSDIDAPEAIVVTVTSSDTKILTITDASVTIAKGKKEIKGKFKGVAEGKANIVIATTSAVATLATDKIEVTVSEEVIIAPELSLKVALAEVMVGNNAMFTVTSNVNATADIVVNIVSDNAAVTVPATVTIASGTKSITGIYTAVSEGNAKLTISTAIEGVTIKVASADVVVTPVVIETLNITCDAANAWLSWYGAIPRDSKWVDFGFGLWFSEVVLMENLGCDYYGTNLAFTAVEKGTAISTLTLTENTEHKLMGTNKGDGSTILPSFTAINGEAYVVYNVMGPNGIRPTFDTDNALTNADAITRDAQKGFQRTGWAKVNVTEGGKVVTVIEIKFPATVVGE